MDKVKNKIFVFDLDQTLCSTPNDDEGKPLYDKSEPFKERIELVNNLYKSGNQIIIDSARGSSSGNDYYDFTLKQLDDWGLLFHTLRTGIKFTSDFYIDDKGINSEEYFKN